MRNAKLSDDYTMKQIKRMQGVQPGPDLNPDDASVCLDSFMCTKTKMTKSGCKTMCAQRVERSLMALHFIQLADTFV